MTDTMHFTQTKEGCRFDKYTGNASLVQVPSHLDGEPVTIIGNKAFLSCKTIEELILPDTVDKIEDWAFAHMHNLKKLTLSAKSISFGRKILLDCPCLSKIEFSNLSKTPEGFSVFLASAFLNFPSPDLLDLTHLQTTKGQADWLSLYDPALLKFIHQEDDHDFEPAFIGWFDVEDLDDQKQNFMDSVKRGKLQLVMQRLTWSTLLSDESKNQMADYLTSNRLFLLDGFSQRHFPDTNALLYFKALDMFGILDDDFCRILLETRDDFDPEIKSFFINKQISDDNTFFDDLLL